MSTCHVHQSQSSASLFLFFFNDTATPEIYTLSLHDALPICRPLAGMCTSRDGSACCSCGSRTSVAWPLRPCSSSCRDRKSTRLNSSHSQISYAVFCLKKKKELQ